MRRFLPFVLFVFAFAAPAFAQEQAAEQVDDLPVYYAVRREASIYRSPESEEVYVQLRFREPVFLLKEANGWSYVRTQDGARGYIRSSALSNVWIRVSKSRKTVAVYRGTELLKKYPADFGYNAFSDKERRGSSTNPDDWRTPEGVFFVVKKNPRSQFHRAFVLNYPNAEDAERGRRLGIISQSEYAAIVSAEESFSMPPMHTALGGMIEIHGSGTGVGSNWTQGCVALHNDHIDEIWNLAEVGTPVLIED